MFLLNMQKLQPEDILMKITVYNRGTGRAPLHVLPTHLVPEYLGLGLCQRR